MTPERHKYLMKSVLGVDIDAIATEVMAEHNLDLSIASVYHTPLLNEQLRKTYEAMTPNFPELNFKRGNIVICNIGR